eukprot:145940-Hanusia_phi.AAC.1
MGEEQTQSADIYTATVGNMTPGARDNFMWDGAHESRETTDDDQKTCLFDACDFAMGSVLTQKHGDCCILLASDHRCYRSRHS